MQPLLLSVALPYIDDNYRTLCEKGEIYTYLTKKYYKKLTEQKGFEHAKKHLKDEMLILMFGEVSDKKKLYKIFEREFPITLNSFVELRKKMNGSELAILLQKMESNLVVRTIMPKLLKEGIGCLTIHDAVAVNIEFEFRTREIMKQELMNMYFVNGLIK